MNVLIRLMWLQWTDSQTPAALRDLIVFLCRRERDAGNVINVILTVFFYSLILNALFLAFEGGSTLWRKHMKTAQKVIWHYCCLCICQNVVLFSISNTSRPVFGKVSDAFVWCNGHTQWPVGLITYVYSLWICEAVCSRNCYLYTMTAWNLTQ